MALSLYNEWSKYNFDKVELVNYTVYLSYANQSNPNVLLLEDSSGDVLYNASTAQEPPLTPGENNESVARPFNAYSGLGNVSVSDRSSNYVFGLQMLCYKCIDILPVFGSSWVTRQVEHFIQTPHATLHAALN